MNKALVSLARRTQEIVSTVAFRNICSDLVLAGVPGPEVLCSLGFLGWLGETFHEEIVGGTVCSRWAKTMIVSVAPFYYLQGFTKRMMKETSSISIWCILNDDSLAAIYPSSWCFCCFTWETPSGQKIVVLSAMYKKKQIKIFWNINYIRLRRIKFDGCDIWIICLELNWIIYDLSRTLQLSEFVWTSSSVWAVLNHLLVTGATDRNWISSNHHRILFDVNPYLVSFFVSTPFKGLCLCSKTQNISE